MHLTIARGKEKLLLTVSYFSEVFGCCEIVFARALKVTSLQSIGGYEPP
jgi:hypothetical protein